MRQFNLAAKMHRWGKAEVEAEAGPVKVRSQVFCRVQLNRFGLRALIRWEMIWIGGIG
jgi:hypothetical protein